MIGRTISHYRVLEKLGQGGMGEVYLTEDLRLQRRVALKILPAATADDPARIERFEREARALAALNHPNIVTIYSVEEAAGLRFVTMELVEGTTLDEILPEDGLDAERFLELAVPIAEAVAAAHARGITHRDLKPANIMVTPEGRVKVLDFGLAKLQTRDHEEALTELPTGVTTPGALLGTMAYMSPEQLRGQPADPRSDVFSLGVIFYRMLTGRAPFAQDSSANLIAAVLRDTPSLVEEGSTGFPPAIARILGRCLEKDPEERHASAAELHADLLAADTAAARPALRLPVPRRVVGLVVVAALLAATAAVGLRGIWRPGGIGTADVSARTTVAVLGFQNLGSEAAGWLSTALSELLSTELAAGGELRVIPGESVARMKLELALPEVGTLAADTLRSISDNLGTDLVVVGNYMLLERGDQPGQLQLNLSLQDAHTGETLATRRHSGTESQLFALLTRAGNDLRQELGIRSLSASEQAGVRATTSGNADATRLYSEGLDRLRSFNANGALELLQDAVEADPEFALAHAALSRAWSELGYDARAAEAAGHAAELAEGLPRTEYLLIQARHQEMSGRLDEAIDTYRVLAGFHADNVDYGLLLADAQTRARRARQALGTLEQLRALPPPAGEDPRIDLAESLAATELADHQRALAAAQRAAEGGRRVGAAILVAQAQAAAGWLHDLLGDPEAAAAALQDAAAIFEAVGDRHDLARVRNTEAVLHKYAGELDLAEQKYQEAIAAHRATGSRYGQARSLSNLAVLLQERGEFGEAKAMLEEALGLAREIPDPRLESLALVNLAYGSLRTGDLDEAEATTARSLQLDSDAGDRNGVAWNLYNRGRIELERDELEEAAATLEEALAICRELEYEHLQAYVLVALGEVRTAAGEHDAARRALDESVRIRERLGEQSTLAESRLALAVLSLETGAAAQAETLARSAADEFARGGRADEEVRALALLASTAVARGDLATAAAILEGESFQPDDSDDPVTRIMASLAGARLARARGDATGATELAAAAATEARRHGLRRMERRAQAFVAGT